MCYLLELIKFIRIFSEILNFMVANSSDLSLTLKVAPGPHRRELLSPGIYLAVFLRFRFECAQDPEFMVFRLQPRSECLTTVRVITRRSA